MGSSPHTRGAPAPSGPPRATWRIIPAYAGSTIPFLAASQAVEDHPRIRGEHPSHVSTEISPKGSSPHTRGALLVVMVTLRGCGIIPAYAGSTISSPRRAAGPGDHPRIRGEHCPRVSQSPTRRGSSPHTRGARGLRGSGDAGAGIIPAYAGSTGGPHTTSKHPWDHPRIRGEHALVHRLPWMASGSSPHTRGAPSVPWWRRRRLRIIPAYAGSTLGNPCNTKDRRRDYTSFPLPVTHPSGGGGS